MDLTVKAYAHTLEESIGCFLSSVSGFSNVFIICLGKECEKLSWKKLISSSSVFICVLFVCLFLYRWLRRLLLIHFQIPAEVQKECVYTRNGKTLIVHYRTLSFFAFRFKKNENSLFFAFSSTKSLSNLFASLRYCIVLRKTSSLRFANLIFGNNYVCFASPDSQFNINHLRFAPLIWFLAITKFASLR